MHYSKFHIGWLMLEERAGKSVRATRVPQWYKRRPEADSESVLCIERRERNGDAKGLKRMHFSKRVLQAAGALTLITPNSSCDDCNTRYYMIIPGGAVLQCWACCFCCCALCAVYTHTCESYSIMKVPRAPAYTIHRVVCALSTWVSVIAKLSILTQL